MSLPAINFKFKISNLKLKNGFTLIELLVVISIIGLLAAFAAASYTSVQMKARDGKRKTDLKAIQQALDTYYQTNGWYPMYAGVAYIKCNTKDSSGNSVDSSVHVWGTSFHCLSASGNDITYMNLLPTDPTNNIYRYVAIGTTPATYQINSILENTNDPDYCDGSGSNCIATGKLPCQPLITYNYCVINP